jgi:hypothetical protein
MSDYAWVQIDASDDFDKLVGELDPEFDPSTVVAKLKTAISLRVGGVLIERGYIDKDYRSTFYMHYAKKGRFYRDDCVRLHFFDPAVSYDEDTSELKSLTGLLAGQYFGFMVLRPTIQATIGRSTLSPDIRIGARGHAIQGEHSVHLLGHKLRVWGFPSMSQHADISICAHVCCWSILRHYSERHTGHREWLLQDITMMASPYDPGGLTPGLGLSALSAKRILEAAGTYPLLIGKKPGEEEQFYAQFLAYLESGFPLFVAMSGKEHAVVAVGHSWAKVGNKPPFLNSHAWEQVESILTNDDNALPYVCVNRDPVSGALPVPGGPNYDANDFSAFIVPLPEKIFYSAVAIEEYSKDTLYDFLRKVIPMPPPQQLLRRYFVTTVSVLRRDAEKKRSTLGPKLVNMFMRLKTAQFVWVVEYASYDQWSKEQIAAIAVVDATASPHDKVPVWFAHGEQVGILFDRDVPFAPPQEVALNRPKGATLGRIEQNLRPIRPRKSGTGGAGGASASLGDGHAQ